MSQASDGFELRDSLIALPQRLLLLIACIPLVAAGLGVYLLFSETSDSVRTAGIVLITLATPSLTVAVGLAAAARVRTDDIDRLVATWLANTVAEKLSGYLVGTDKSPGSRLFPPLFRHVRAVSDRATSSYCVYEITDFEDRSYFLFAKSNIFNVEIGLFFALTGTARDIPTAPVHLTDMASWAASRDDPRVMCVADVLYGAVSEGYSVYITNAKNRDGDYVTYRFRQKLHTQFVTSPYTRRYFAEDFAILSYWLYWEIHRADAVSVGASCGPLTDVVVTRQPQEPLDGRPLTIDR